MNKRFVPPAPMLPRYDLPMRTEARAWHRAIAAHVIAKCSKSLPGKILKANWPEDARAAEILKAPTAPTATTDVGAPIRDTTRAFRSLAPGSAALRLFERSQKLDLAGLHTIRIPRVGGLPPAPLFIQEGKAAPSVQWTSAATTLGPVKKILIISGTSAELNDATPGTSVAVIGRVLADSSNVAIDLSAFGTQAGDAINPPGLLYGVVPQTPAAAGPDAMATDLSALVEAIGNNRIDTTGVVFVASPREATMIKLKAGPHFDSEVFPSLGLPDKSVAAFAPAAIFYAFDGSPTIDTSEDVAIHFEDTSPQDIVSGSGTAAAPVKSMFQTELIAIKVRAWACWACSLGGSAIVAGVNW